MRFQMRQQLFSLTDDYIIEDEQGQTAFIARGRLFSFGDKLTLWDPEGNELVRIEQKLFSLSPTYQIFYGDELFATVRKELFTIFNCRFMVDIPGPDDLEASGDLIDYEYTFEREGQVVANVSKRWFTFQDVYGIEVVDDEDPVLILASSIVIDLACHGDRV